MFLDMNGLHGCSNSILPARKCAMRIYLQARQAWAGERWRCVLLRQLIACSRLLPVSPVESAAFALKLHACSSLTCL